MEIKEVKIKNGKSFELESGEVVDFNELLLRIYNKLLDIEKSVKN